MTATSALKFAVVSVVSTGVSAVRLRMEERQSSEEKLNIDDSSSAPYEDYLDLPEKSISGIAFGFVIAGRYISTMEAFEEHKRLANNVKSTKNLKKFLETLQTLLIEKKDLIERTKKTKGCCEMFFGGSSQEDPLVEVHKDLKFLDLLKDFATTNNTTYILKRKAEELFNESKLKKAGRWNSKFNESKKLNG